MARNKAFDPIQVLDGALQLFWMNGYESTSLDALLEAAGLSKSSFYGAFGSKHELLIACVDRYIATVLAANLADLERGSPREAILRSFEKVLAFKSSTKTCFLQVCAIELAGRDPLVRSRIRTGFELWQEAYRRAISRGQATGEFAADVDAHAVAAFLVTNLYGLQTLARANLRLEQRRKALELAMAGLPGNCPAQSRRT